MLRYIVPILLGNMLEFYDIMLFGFYAPLLGKIFYSENANFSLLAQIYISFAIGFLFRPIGSIYFGYVADRLGRKTALLWSMILMSISTLGIATLPSYEKIGFSATILVTIFRALQGFSAGGEYNNAAIYLIEYNNKFKNFSSALLVVSGVIGSLLASVALKITSLENLPYWSWRIAFGLGSCISLVGFFLRISLLETKIFTDEINKKKLVSNPILTIFKDKPSEVLTTFIVGGFNGLIYYFQFVFLVNYLPSLNISNSNSSYLNIFGQVCYAIFIMIVGFVSNRFGAKKLMIFSCLGYGLFIIPATSLFLKNNIYSLYMYQFILSFLSSCFCGVKHVFLAELFPVNLRSSGVSFGYGMGVAFFGGTAPLFLSFLAKYDNFLVASYVAVVAIICYLRVKMKNYNPR